MRYLVNSIIDITLVKSPQAQPLLYASFLTILTTPLDIKYGASRNPFNFLASS